MANILCSSFYNNQEEVEAAPQRKKISNGMR